VHATGGRARRAAGLNCKDVEQHNGLRLNDSVQFNGTSYIAVQADRQQPDTSPTSGVSGGNRSYRTTGRRCCGATDLPATGQPALPDHRTAGPTVPRRDGSDGRDRQAGLIWQGLEQHNAYALNDAVQFNGTS